jgi:hypothetical protein
MRPGEACLNCHNGQGGGDDNGGGGNSGPGGGGGDDNGGGDDDNAAELYTIAGTVYNTPHEPNDCQSNATSRGTTTVAVHDAAGRTITMTANAVGNFFSTSAVTFPITAVVSRNGLQRAMTVGQTSANCNMCHTQTGANGAPGRILAP